MKTIPAKGELPAKNICVSVARPNADEVLACLENNRSEADLFEVRLDALQTIPDLKIFRRATDRPLLFTCRPEWEGGLFKGEEEQRLQLLEGAVKAGADIIDLELRASEEMRGKLLAACAASSCGLLLSWHDFSTTPSSQGLLQLFQQMYRSGAHFGKIVTTARDFKDVLRVLALQKEAAEMSFPLVAFCMGEIGKISRLATLELGGFMTYAAPVAGAATAPGQLSASSLRQILEKLHHAD